MPTKIVPFNFRLIGQSSSHASTNGQSLFPSESRQCQRLLVSQSIPPQFRKRLLEQSFHLAQWFSPFHKNSIYLFIVFCNWLELFRIWRSNNLLPQIIMHFILSKITDYHSLLPSRICWRGSRLLPFVVLKKNFFLWLTGGGTVCHLQYPHRNAAD